MALRNIIKDPDPGLRKISREVTNFDDRLRELIDDMRDTMHKADGCGIAAPQVGILRRAAIIETRKDFYLEMVNPEIIESGGEQIGAEGCLSIEGYNCNVARPQYIVLRAFDRFGKRYELRLEDFEARACCHEIDHLDGILFKDKFHSEVKKEGK
ncbi:MAG: peptide deformylase [Clostridiaceae bacterium]|jgi:peptide deformylase|nr:peptide deformylase [Clostridiaceae bacterium]